MRHFNFEFDYSVESGVFSFYTLSDLHVGGIIDEQLLDRVISEIAQSPHAYWFGGGDMIDAINKRDKRFNPDSIASWVSLRDPVSSEVEYLVEKLRPIKDKCLGIVEGNHEFTVSSVWERDVHQHICSALGVRSFGPIASFNLVFRRGSGKNRGGVVTIPGVIAHGSGSAVSYGNEERSLRVPLEMFDTFANARISLLGHTHDCHAVVVDRLFICRNDTVKLSCIAGRMGSFLLYVDYAQRANYRPVRADYLRFYVAPYRNLLTLDLRKALGG